MRKYIFLTLLLFTLILAGCSETPEDSSNNKPEKSTTGLQVHFIDVGQADAILVENGHSAMLVDAGNNDDGELVVNYLRQRGIQKLDVVMGTHPHEDHIGGLDDVLKAFAVEQVYLPKVTHMTETYRDVLQAIKSKNLKATPAVGGQHFQLGQADVEIFGPNGTGYKELNDYSIVCKVSYGETSFLLTGDAEELVEQEMLKRGYNLKANVLKVGHHGSHSSTSEKFLQAVSPQYAVISVGKDNDYGHPHLETLQKLAQHKVKVYQTAQVGTIVMTSDGNTVSIKTTKSQPVEQPKSQVSVQQYVDQQGQGLIKGNISHSGAKIYHMPGQVNYEKTKPEVWFKTEQEAQDAGFRRAER